MELPEPPYYAVIFTSRLKPEVQGYEDVSERMVELGSAQPGFLGIEGARNAARFGITVSYWQDLESIKAWRRNTEHLLAQESGRSTFYEAYDVRIAKVERAYSFSNDA